MKASFAVTLLCLSAVPQVSGEDRGAPRAGRNEAIWHATAVSCRQGRNDTVHADFVADAQYVHAPFERTIVKRKLSDGTIVGDAPWPVAEFPIVRYHSRGGKYSVWLLGDEQRSDGGDDYREIYYALNSLPSQVHKLEGHRLEGDDLGPSQILLSDAFDRLVSYGSDDTMRLWDLKLGREVVRIQHHLNSPGVPYSHYQAAFSSTGFLAVAGGSGVALYSAHNGELWELWKVPFVSRFLRFDPTGKRLLVFGFRHTAVGELPGPHYLAQIEIESENVFETKVHNLEPGITVSDVCFSQDGSTAVLWNTAGKIQVWDLNQRRRRFAFETVTEDVRNVALAPNSEVIVVLRGGIDLETHRLSDGKQLDRIPLVEPENENGELAYVRFSQDGKHLIAVDLVDEMSVWKTTGACHVRGAPPDQQKYDGRSF